MVNKLIFKQIDFKNHNLLKVFIENSGNSLKSFRYFENRDFKVLNDHILTVILLKNNCPIGYGHLDQDKKKLLWLGISLIDTEIGKGYGKKIMNYLIDVFNKSSFNDLFLTVDKNNFNVVQLYKKYGFIKLKNNNASTLLMVKRKWQYYISTMAFKNFSFKEIDNLSINYNLPIEYSSGLKYEENLNQHFLSANSLRIPHNYFPPAKDSFVINLASKNEKIRKKSINHCINGLKLAKQVNAPFFSAHAGFCIDPNEDELGKKINYDKIENRLDNYNIFIESLNTILNYAKDYEINFLIENNVLTSENYYSEINPLFCCDGEEILNVFKDLKNPCLGLLLDTAHLKVSCNTLNLNLEKEYGKIKHLIKGIHHSDNDGLVDDNQSLSENYWFLKHINEFKKIVHVIEVKNMNIEQINNQVKLLFK